MENHQYREENEETVSGERQGGRSPSGISPDRAINKPNPEVSEKPTRRRFTAEYKLRIIEEADNCSSLGEVGALLRREGLYESHLYRWRKRKREGAYGALTPEKRGPKKKQVNPLEKKVADLERENRKLRNKLKTAETIIDVQKKVSGLLGIDLASPESDEENS